MTSKNQILLKSYTCSSLNLLDIWTSALGRQKVLSDYNHMTRSFVRVFLVFPEMSDKFLHIVRICQKILRNFLKTNLFQNRYQYIIQFCTFGETNASGNCCPSNSLNKEKTSVLEISEKKSYRPVIQFHLFVKK